MQPTVGAPPCERQELLAPLDRLEAAGLRVLVPSAMLGPTTMANR